jgi:hypothetical protein
MAILRGANMVNIDTIKISSDIILRAPIFMKKNFSTKLKENQLEILIIILYKNKIYK